MYIDLVLWKSFRKHILLKCNDHFLPFLRWHMKRLEPLPPHGSIVLLRGWRITQWPLPSRFMGQSEFIAGEHWFHMLTMSRHSNSLNISMCKSYIFGFPGSCLFKKNPTERLQVQKSNFNSEYGSWNEKISAGLKLTQCNSKKSLRIADVRGDGTGFHGAMHVWVGPC